MYMCFSSLGYTLGGFFWSVMAERLSARLSRFDVREVPSLLFTAIYVYYSDLGDLTAVTSMYSTRQQTETS